MRRVLRHGYEAVNLGDVAGITSDRYGAGVIFAVDRTVALLSYGAYSDTKSSHPPAHRVRFKAEDKAAQIASHLRDEGCPRYPRKCSTTRSE